MGKIITLLLMRFWNFLTKLLAPIEYESAVVMNYFYASFKDKDGIPYTIISELCVIKQTYTPFKFRRRRYIQRVKVLYMLEGRECPINIFHFPLLSSKLFINTEGPLISAMNTVLRMDKFKGLKVNEESIAYRRHPLISTPQHDRTI